MPELVLTLESINKKDMEEKKFFAKLKGIDLDEEGSNQGQTFDDVRRKALGIDASGDDVVSLQGVLAHEAGFGVGAGLGYSKE
jgi:hypothetical protein